MLLDLKVNELFENSLFITLAGESPMSLYPFDQTGLNPANRISNEAHVVSAINGVDHNYIVPENAPFFKESLVVVNSATGQILEPGVDYTFTHKFGEAEAHMARKLYGSFTFLNPNTTGTFRIAYQTLGGDFVTSFTRAIGNGIAALAGLLTVDWTTLSGLPPTFPVTSHTHPVTGVNGVKQFLDIMALIKEGIIDPNQSLHLDDVTDLDKRFITPLLLGLQDIRATIATSENANLPWASISSASTQTDLGAKTNGTWFDLPLTVDAPVTGTFVPMWHINEFAINEATAYVEVRYLVGTGTVSTSSMKFAPIALNKGTTIKLQARVVGSDVAAFYIGNKGQASTLTLVRIGQ